MRKPVVVIPIVLSASFTLSAPAQNAAPRLGKWKTLDDQTCKPMTVTDIYLAKKGTLAAKIVENMGLTATCTTCSGEYKNQPAVGMVTLWNLKDKNGICSDGNGYKSSGDTMLKVKSLKLVEGGSKLEVTGCKSILCRIATCVRVN